MPVRGYDSDHVRWGLTSLARRRKGSGKNAWGCACGRVTRAGFSDKQPPMQSARAVLIVSALVGATASPAFAQPAPASAGGERRTTGTSTTPATSAAPTAPRTTTTTSAAAGPNAANASAAAEAEALVARGVELRQRGGDEEALALFRRAFQLSHTPRAQAQIGLAEQALGRWADAEREMQAALLDHTDPWIARNRVALENAVRVIQAHLATLQVATNAPHATLWLNGVQVASLPMTSPLRYEIGTVAIEVRASGYITARRVIELAAGISQRENLNLVPREASEAGGDAPASQTSASRPAATSPHSAATSDDSTMRTASTALLAGAVVFAVGGIAGHAYWQSRVAIYNDNDQCFYGEMSRMERCGEVLANANTGAALTVVGYVGAGVLLAAGVIVRYLASGERATGTSASALPATPSVVSHRAQIVQSFMCGPGPAALGAACGVAF